MAFQPHLFVAQERIQLSTAPSWVADNLAPRPVGVRVYLVATAEGYKVMPGGLARIAPDDAARFISMQRGGASKDTWVLSDDPVNEDTLLHNGARSVELRRVGNNLPSRMADNFFWLGRYAERADATARLLRSALLRFNPESTGSAMPVLAPILKTLEVAGQIESIDKKRDLHKNAEALEAELLAAIFDPARIGSLRYIADRLERLTIMVRDRTSNDLWRVVSQLDDRLARPASSLAMLAGDAVGVLNLTLLGLAAFHGLATENMTRAQGWRFLDMGRRIERALYLCAFLGSTLRSSEADNTSVLEAVLEVADSSITYRSRYNVLPNIAAVYDLVLLDDTNPRSLLFQLQQIEEHFEQLPREKLSALPSPAQRIVLDCVTRLRLTDPTELAHRDVKAAESVVAKVIQHVAHELPRLSDAIAVSYFAHSAISRAGATNAQ